MFALRWRIGVKYTSLVALCTMNAIALKQGHIGRPGRCMPENGYGWEYTLQAVNDAVITRPFCVRMHLALQLFIITVGATNGEGRPHHQNSEWGKL